MENSKIQWTNHTFNAWRGCSKVHTGCEGCYAEKLTSRQLPGVGPVVWGPNGTRVVADNWSGPIRWNNRAKKEGQRVRVFLNSLSDVFESYHGNLLDLDGNEWWTTSGRDWVRAVPVGTFRQLPGSRPLSLDDVRGRVFEVAEQTPWIDWQFVTKRPENIRGMTGGTRRSNAWLLTSVSNQATADKQVPELLKCRDLSPVLGLSCEPLLGPIDLRAWLKDLDWVIVGGESDQPGHKTRPCAIEWIWDIVLQCLCAGVPVFVKQLGSFSVVENVNTFDDVACAIEEGKLDCTGWGEYAASLRLIWNEHKGGDSREWPEGLSYRQFPSVAV